MEIKEMDLEQVETRLAEVKDMLHEDGADLEALETEIRSLKDRKQEIHAEIEARKAEVKEVMETAKEVRTFEEERTHEKMDIKELRNSKEYIDAYAEYIKGDDKAVRSLLTTNAEDGTVAVPELVYDIVKTAWEKNDILARVRKTFMKGNLKVGFEISSTGAVAHTEGDDAPNEEALVLGIVNLVPVSVKKWISISDEVYDLRGEDFLRYVYDELTYQIAKKTAELLITNIVQSVGASTQSKPAVAGLQTNIAVGTIAQALALLSDEATNPVIIMNKATWAEFKAVQYANGYGVDVFEGLPVLFSNALPAYSTATAQQAYAIVGDLENGALANFPNGQEITLKFDDLSLAESDLIKIVGRQYVGIGIVAPNHFTVLAKAAGGNS